MRLLLPRIMQRQAIVRQIRRFFREEEEGLFTTAIEKLCTFYHLQPPKIEWYERLDHPADAGFCHENGTIALLHPSVWKKNRVHHSQKRWVEVALHEIGHYILWSQPEMKADLFAAEMLRK